MRLWLRCPPAADQVHVPASAMATGPNGMLSGVRKHTLAAILLAWILYLHASGREFGLP